ncbi:MAG: helix-turn-helix domain-containing protein [Lachnospiraceae bacterium]|nr:helix-turn-helix domain-containing protein [Lachnospiraceae bacterium]
MSVYLSVAQAQNIVFELMEIVPRGVSVTDEKGSIIASSNAALLGKNSQLAAECIEQASQMQSYNERHYSGNRTATPIFFRNICVGAIIMAGDAERIKRITSIAKAVGENIICQPYFNSTEQVSYVMYYEYISEWLNNKEEYTLSFIRRGVRIGIDVTQPYYAVVLDGVWNPVSAQKAVEKILTGPNYYLCRNNSCLVLILREGDNESIMEQISRIFHDVKIAIGSVETNLNASFVVAQNALFAGKHLHPGKSRYDYRDYEFIYALSRIQDLKINQGVLELLEQPQHSELLQTLEMYIEESGNSAEVIRKLFIHRNTLKYRLDKIQELTGKNPRSFQDLFYLYVQYILYRLTK